MEVMRKGAIILTAAVLFLSGSNEAAMAATEPTATKSLTVTEGKKKSIVVKGTNIKSKTFQSSNTKVATVSKKGIVTAKKAGSCKIKITVKYLKSKKAKKTAKKVLTTKITVEKAAKEAKGDLAVLKKIVEEQNAAGANIPTDFDDKTYYKWSEDGRLQMIFWKGVGLKGDISFSAFTQLEGLKCSQGELTAIDVTGCQLLQELGCGSNQLTSLDVSNCPVLETLDCYGNQLTDLDISGCPILSDLYCYNNQLTSLDISHCPELTLLACPNNQLAGLDLSNCSGLEYLNCCENQLTRLDLDSCPGLEEISCNKNPLTGLDVSKCKRLRTLECDETVSLTGVPAHCNVDTEGVLWEYEEGDWICYG